MLMSHSQKIRQKHSIKMGNRSFEDVAKFKHLGTTLTSKFHAGEHLLPFGSESSVLLPAV
jgi:hypothetical protein